MNRIKGLDAYINSKQFRKRLSIPSDAQIECRLLAQGEYNINYRFTHPVTGKDLVLRVNTGSQMHLENQITYEFQALKLLDQSGRTPHPYFSEEHPKDMNYGILVMDFLEGHALQYRTEMEYAAACLADIHSTGLPENHELIMPKQPLKAILKECEEMFGVYEASPLGIQDKKEQIRKMLHKGHEMLKHQSDYEGYRCLINTELNSGNFLINGLGKENYLVDWEKPLFGDPAQDLGHFMAPTTTFWKTDVILNKEETDRFLEIYIEKVKGRFDISGLKERTSVYIPITCLRGITWASMAWVQYQAPDKLIQNEFTWKKLNQYLDWDFLADIEKTWLVS